MKSPLIAAAFAVCLLTGQAWAVEAGCEAKATERKLSGAARTSFVKKCERDAAAAPVFSAACEKSAADKKLAGAAKTSHLKKCMADEAAAMKKP